jgi:methionyl-tRNA formyltransferase
MKEDASREVFQEPVPARPTALLLGDGPTALSALRSLVQTFRVSRVLRSTAFESDPVRLFAEETGVPVSASLALDGLSTAIGELTPDVVVISSCRFIIPPSLLRLSRFVNVHYSLLPTYRGRANVNWAIINGETATGITIHSVTPDLDGGSILFQEAIPIGPNDTASSLYERLNSIQERELGAAVTRAIAGDAGIVQKAEEATYGCSRIPSDGEIDWKQTSVQIDRLVRALAPPFPGAFTYLDCKRLTICRVAPLSSPPTFVGRIPGRIVGRSSSEGWVDVLTGDGVMRVFVVADCETNAPVPAATMVRSTRTTLGISPSDLLQRISELEERLADLKSVP